LNFDVIPIGLELDFHTFPTIYGMLSNSLIRERTTRFKLAFAAARQNTETTNLSYLISWAIKLYLF
jgi:hypothetical protein